MRKNLKAQVEYCLETYPETRNSDITLMLRIWETYYPSRIKTGASGEKGVWLKDLYDLPREDNIKRVRAKFQNELNRYLPTDWKVAQQRKIEEDKWRVAMGYPPKDNGTASLLE